MKKKKTVKEAIEQITTEAKPDQLALSSYFQTPVFSIDKPEWVDSLNKVCDEYINAAKNNNKQAIKDREKLLGKKIGDFAMSHHSTSLIGDARITDFQSYVGQTAYNLLGNMGYDMKDHELFFTELWVQEFSEKGGGHHEGHVHYNNHISGFYFLKCSEKTSMPVFHDPRPAKLMSELPELDEKQVTFASRLIHYKPKPGTLIFIPAYLEHQYAVDNGIEPFRFIHFNLQAVRRMITNAVREQTKSGGSGS